MYVCVRGCTRMCPYACVGVNRVFMFICMCWLRATVFRTRSVRFEPSYRRPRPDSGSCRCGSDTQVIRRPINGMIRRSVPVRAVKTRWRFGSETASFHVSVCSHAFSLFTVASSVHVFIRIISCDYLMYFTSVCKCVLVFLLCMRECVLSACVCVGECVGICV